MNQATKSPTLKFWGVIMPNKANPDPTNRVRRAVDELADALNYFETDEERAALALHIKADKISTLIDHLSTIEVASHDDDKAHRAHSFGPNSLDAHATSIVAWLMEQATYLDEALIYSDPIELDYAVAAEIAAGMRALAHMVLNRANGCRQSGLPRISARSWPPVAALEHENGEPLDMDDA